MVPAVLAELCAAEKALFEKLFAVRAGKFGRSRNARFSGRGAL
jgi:hypothetical protein